MMKLMNLGLARLARAGVLLTRVLLVFYMGEQGIDATILKPTVYVSDFSFRLFSFVPMVFNYPDFSV